MGWRFALASATGTSHFQSATPCQDHAAYAFFEAGDGQVLALVAADGAGSARHSDLGAEIAARELIRLVGRHCEAGASIAELSRATAQAWITHIATTLAERAVGDDCDVRDYACTLLAAVLGPESAAFIQIGDGAIVVSHGEEDGWAYVFWPQHGEFANTTNFVVSPNATEALEFELAPRRIEEVALFTDGIENLVLHRATRSVHEPFFNQIFRPVRASEAEGYNEVLSEGLRRYLSGPAVCERTDDDKTLILATRLDKWATAELTEDADKAGAPGPIAADRDAACPIS